MADGVFFRLVSPGAEAAGVVAAYGRAETEAQRVRVMLVAAGVDAESVQVVASLTVGCEPVVVLTPMTDPARRCLAQILPSGSSP